MSTGRSTPGRLGIRSVLRGTRLALLALFVPLGVAAAQVDAATLGAQSLRPYWHVFVAYAVAWLLVFGWLFSVGLRLTRIERRLQR